MNGMDSLFERIKEIRGKIDEFLQTFIGQLITGTLELVLAVAAVVPLMLRICHTVPFTYEANDDAAIVQILDGSFTGKPEAHSIFVRYPLSWLISKCYENNPSQILKIWEGSPVNWFVVVLASLEIFAMVMVLFRLIHAFSGNRILLCILFDLAIVFFWLPCFSQLTFSTAGGFMGCMGMLYFALESREDAWKPWNLIILMIMLGSAFCLRKQCLYMVLPLLAVILLAKYHINFFKSPKPWITGTVIGAVIMALFVIDGKTYGSVDWKQYLLYNHERAYLQDYAGFPDYEEAEDFYKSVGINETGRDAMASYTYCMVDRFDTRWIHNTYHYVKAEEGTPLPLPERLEEAYGELDRMMGYRQGVPGILTGYAWYMWYLLIPLFILTVIFRWKEGIGEHIVSLLAIVSTGILVLGEWLYLTMNGRFPARVEEIIWLLSFSAGFMLVARLLLMWKEAPFTRIPFLIELVVLVLFLRADPITPQIQRLKGEQEYFLAYGEEKEEILAYCGEHEKNYYILDTVSFAKPSTPYCNTKQGNWIMSGSWTAFSPIYDKKVEEAEIRIDAPKRGKLGSTFVKCQEVYIITKGPKYIYRMMGYEEPEDVEAEVVDEIITKNNSFFQVYKVKRIRNVGYSKKTSG